MLLDILHKIYVVEASACNRLLKQLYMSILQTKQW